MEESEIKGYFESMTDEDITAVFAQMVAEQVKMQYAAQVQQQMAAMENGAIYGWDTPMSNPVNYDESGHFYIPTEEVKGWRR